MIRSVLAVEAVGLQATVGAHGLVVGDVPLGEAPLLRHHDLLAARELELGATQRLDHVIAMIFLGADRHHDLVDVDASDRAQRLAIGAAHSSLQP